MVFTEMQDLVARSLTLATAASHGMGRKVVLRVSELTQNRFQTGTAKPQTRVHNEPGSGERDQRDESRNRPGGLCHFDAERVLFGRLDQRERPKLCFLSV